MEGGFIMWKVGLLLLIPSPCHAAGLIDLAREAGPTVGPFLICVVALVIIAVVGGAGHVMLSLCDGGKTLKLLDKGTYMSLLGVLIGMGIMLITSIFKALVEFVRLIFG
jgi:hypothetical protein